MNKKYSWQDKVIQLANDSNTAIYTFDPRGLGPRPSDVLRRSLKTPGAGCFEQRTGGVVATDRQGSERVLPARICAARVAGGRQVPPDQGARETTRRRRARAHGYFAPTLAELESARKASVAEELPPEVARAVSVLAPRPDASGDFWAGASRGPTGAPRVTVSWMPQDATHSPQVSVVATSADGKVYFDGPLTNGATSFDVPPGALKIQRTVLDADGAPKDREEVSIDVPNFASAALAIGSPAFLKARNGLELRQLRAAPDATPYPGKDFERTDHLLVRFSIVGSAAEGATITANLLSKRGASLATLMPFATNRRSKRTCTKSICRLARTRTAST